MHIRNYLQVKSNFKMNDESLQPLNWSEDSGFIINWDEFDFGKEMEALEVSYQIFNEEFKSLTNICEHHNKNSVLNDLQCHTTNNLQLKTKHEKIVHEGKHFIEKCKILSNEVKDLKVRQLKLDQTVKESEEEEARLRAECKMLNTAYNKAIEKYSKNFDLQISSKNISDTKYEATIQFTSKRNMKPIRLIVDRNEGKILEFDTSEIFPEELQEDFIKKYGDLKNIPQMLCTIREYILTTGS